MPGLFILCSLAVADHRAKVGIVSWPDSIAALRIAIFTGAAR
jgi:hypothetical protein